MTSHLTKIEQKAIQAMESIHGNKYTLQPSDPIFHFGGYLMSFHLSSGEVYLVKVWDNDSAPQIYKHIQ
jgi:hypothetical protein